MAVESPMNYIGDLNASNPAGSASLSEADDHLRGMKTVLKQTFTGGGSGLSGAVTPTHTELNYVGGVTSAIQTQLNTKLSVARYPVSTTTTTAVAGDAGKVIALSAGITVPNSTFAAGDVVGFFNDSGSSVSLLRGSGLAMYWGGFDGNFSLGSKRTAFIWFHTTSVCVVIGT